MIVRNTQLKLSTRLALSAIAASLILVTLTISFYGLLIARVERNAEIDLQTTAGEFVTFSHQHSVDSAESLLTEFIAEFPLHADQTLVGVTPEQLIQSEWSKRSLTSGDALISAALESPTNSGVVNKLEGPVYWARVDIVGTDSTLLIARFTGADRHDARRMIRMLVSIVLAGVSIALTVWWMIRIHRPAAELTHISITRLVEHLAENAELTVGTSISAEVIVRADISALAQALKSAAQFCAGAEICVDLQESTAAVWVYSRHLQLSSAELNNIFTEPALTDLQVAAQQHGATAWAESTPESGIAIGIDLPIFQDRRNHAFSD